MKEYLTSLFDNRTWGVLVPNASVVADSPGVDPGGLWKEWCHPSTTIFGTLAFFLLMKVAVPPPLPVPVPPPRDCAPTRDGVPVGMTPPPCLPSSGC